MSKQSACSEMHRKRGVPFQVHHIRVHIRIGCSHTGASINEATSSVLSKESITK